MTRRLPRLKPVKLPPPARPSTGARAFHTRKFWPSSGFLSKISREWAALHPTRTKRVDKHGQERYLDRASQGSTPLHGSSAALRILDALARYLERVKAMSNVSKTSNLRSCCCDSATTAS